MGGYILILVFLAVLWFLIIRPQRRRQTDAQVAGRGAIDLLATLPVAIPGLVIGVAYLWAWIGLPGGLYGTITALGEDEARVQIADGVEVRIAKRAIAGVLSDDEEPEEPEELEEKSTANLP